MKTEEIKKQIELLQIELAKAELKEKLQATPRPFKVYLFGVEQPEIFYSPKLCAEFYNVSHQTVMRRLKLITVNPILGIDCKYLL